MNPNWAPKVEILRAAVQAEMDFISETRPGEIRFADVGDALKLKRLVTLYCEGVASCGWERVLDGTVPAKDVLIGLPVITQTATGRVVAFQVYNPQHRPACEITSLAVDPRAGMAKAVKAVFLGAIPVYRALLRFGWDTVYAPTIPDNIKTRMSDKMDGGSLLINAQQVGRDVDTDIPVHSLQVDIRKMLARMTKAVL